MKSVPLERKIVNQILKNHPIPEELQNSKYPFYYKSYTDNLYCPMEEEAKHAYSVGNGGEINEQAISRNGIAYTIPAKMASIASSSAMTFNLLGNGTVKFLQNDVFPQYHYSVEYEKQMYTIAGGNRPAHLDAFLSNEKNKSAVFCEMKFLEWLGTPREITKAYFMKRYYFKEDMSTVAVAQDAFEIFFELAEILKKEDFRCYDAAQMFRHLLAIYNYTSFVTEEAVNAFDCGKSMAGKYNNIILANVVNEFPAELIEDEESRIQYEKALVEERKEAEMFCKTVRESRIPLLFKNNCKADVSVKYISADKFADTMDISSHKREYLKRYYT